jgi:hypothetical protein
LLFHKNLVEATNRLFEFAAEALGTFSVAFGRKLYGTAGTAGPRDRASAVTSIATAAGVGGRFAVAVVCRTGATTEALTGLTHTADTARQVARVAAVTIAVTVTVAVTIAIRITIGAAVRTRESTRHFNLRHAADTARRSAAAS